MDEGARWLPISEAPGPVKEVIRHMTIPPVGGYFIKVTTLDEKEVLLVRFGMLDRVQPIQFFIVPHPESHRQ